MTLLAVCGGLLLAVALIVREYQLGRERTARLAALEQLHGSLEAAGRQLRRAREDIYVLRTVLQERGVISEEELARGRARLIEAPRRRAEERSEMLRELQVPSTKVILDEGESIH